MASGEEEPVPGAGFGEESDSGLLRESFRKRAAVVLPTRSPKLSHSPQPPNLGDPAEHLSETSGDSLEAMSEGEVPSPFSRGSRTRASLPVVRSTNQTKERSLGTGEESGGDIVNTEENTGRKNRSKRKQGIERNVASDSQNGYRCPAPCGQSQMCLPRSFAVAHVLEQQKHLSRGERTAFHENTKDDLVPARHPSSGAEQVRDPRQAS
ncbi:Sickle tail protein [Fukomys damarensis]|uniref:Sickle tail protein n=1 Tax=Fukomys damarensis TaxID=885580 RepID=A0A091DXR5_FUKDA|nr:Sickle tail protein [Fukomys damarensis]